MADLEKAILLGVRAHEGQKDKAGEAYVLHPLRIMLRMESENARITAVLHDVVEDTPFSFADILKEGFSSEVLDALHCLTRREGEDYDAFIDRIACNPLAVEVKIADLEDNMDMKRIDRLNDKDLARFKKYHRAWLKLKRVAKAP